MTNAETLQVVRRRFAELIELRPACSGILGDALPGAFGLGGELPSMLTTEYPNEPFVRPDSGQWARFTVRASDHGQQSFGDVGDRRFRKRYMLMIQVFESLDMGTGNSEILCEYIKGVFDSKSIDGVLYRTATVEPIGRSENWFQHNVVCPFQSDDIR